MKVCKNCGTEINDKAVVCVNCGCKTKEKKPFYKKWWFWLLVAFILISIIAGSNSTETTENSTGTETSNLVSTNSENTSNIPKEFIGDCPVEVTANIEDNMIGFPELVANIKNNTDKEITAVQIYFIPTDVYGEEVNTMFTNNKLYTDDTIKGKGSTTRNWSLLDQEIKSGDVYLYSVYFTDGTEWGDKDASVSKIKKYGIKISVNE